MTDLNPAERARGSLENLRLRLLDLTARNRLINFRHTKNASFRIVNEMPNRLVETLLADTEMRFGAIPEPTEEDLVGAGYLEFSEEEKRLVRLRNNPTAEEWAKHLGLSTSYEAPGVNATSGATKEAGNTIHTLLYPHEMEVRLKKLLQASESAIQEMGANILYLACGFLEWYDVNGSESSRIAPLFLVPVRLRKGRLNPVNSTYEYTLAYSGEDLIPNLSLREKLRADFAMALPDLDENTLPEDYFGQVQRLIKNKQPRWRLRRFISLALLNFSKLLMYLDLDPERWPADANIVDHLVVSRFLSGYGQNSDVDDEPVDGPLFGEEHRVDEMDDIHANYPLIDDADSSQHSALIDAVDGKNLVIEGPPGTGKSQTITNLIAAAIARGKKVLFVAEKLAALEVVRSRLDDAGLGGFCLELHSHKSQKRKVLDEVGERLSKRGLFRRPQDIQVEIDRYEELKTELKNYAEKINRSWKNTGKTLHEIFMAATRYRKAIKVRLEDYHPDGYTGSNYDPAAQRRNVDQVEAYRKLYQVVAVQWGGDSALHGHPWYGVCNGDLQFFDLDRVRETLGEWQDALQLLRSQRDGMAHAFRCEASAIAETLTGARTFLDELEGIPAQQGDELLDRLPVLRGETLAKAGQYLKLFEDIEGQLASLAPKVGPEILQNLPVVERLISGSEQLKRLVGHQVKLGELAEAINRLSALHDQLTQLEKPLQGVSSALGEPSGKYLTMSQSGLAEFGTLVALIASLNPSYWKQRDELFDNEELDELLPQLRAEIEELGCLRDLVQEVFLVDSIPDENEIQRLAGRLAAGGFFRWFKSDWRDARKKLLGYAANAQVKYPAMGALLGELAKFAGKRSRLASNDRYKDALGDSLRGLDTDLDALESLRGWYKSVRKQYGVGFGEKVALGEAVLTLSPNVAKAIRSLAERGIQKQIGDLLEDLESLREVFFPVAELHDGDALLLGEKGLISRLLSEVGQAVKVCEPLIGYISLSVEDMADLIEQVGSLKQQVEDWRAADLDQKLFQGRLGLTAGVGMDNSAGLPALRNTLKLAAHIDSHLSNQILVAQIYRFPNEETFSSLVLHAEQLRGAITTEQEACDLFATMVRLDRAGWTCSTGDRIDDVISRNRLALDNGVTLQGWLDYVRVREQMDGLGLGRIAVGVERGEFEVEQVLEVYQASIFDVLAREILREDPELGRFSGHSQEAVQEKFREYDNKLKKLQCEQIAWKIDQAIIPIGNMAARVSQRTERVLLEHECAKKNRHIPLRQLLKRAGGALVALKPCFMMGPMSVAQYLAPGKIAFDLVVMDEASQIKPQDALGAIARGTQLVVVGDPKQLPPTSFFDRIIEDDDEDDPTGIEESESILDATLTMFPARRLRWHYRSQHENLIAFSNHSFYGGDLVLFPSPHRETKEYGIQYSRVSRGCFVNRRNMEEARIISEAVRDHFRHYPDATLGVVAMSAEQRTQIERAVETLAKDDPVFQGWLERDEAQRESLFIKNLENVQGDERDVIFISMTYGPQEPGGKVYQRFGPINSDVGWRRLNVLFTRSKKRMHIFSSMGSEDIVAGPTSRRGVQALRDFLKFSETGILHKIERVSERGQDSDFEIAVISALDDAGFECTPQVGVAGFFIDVAVVDPGNPGRYLMGIECDGATYHSAKSTRDRDRLRQTILERLGWRIRRIWSTDWFKNPAGELAPIIRELHELKSQVVEVDESESAVIEAKEIVEETDIDDSTADQFAFDSTSLREKLLRFDREVIREEVSETPENKRLLRPVMIEELLKHTPTSREEFLELVPSYIRQATATAEGKYLGRVFDIINASL